MTTRRWDLSTGVPPRRVLMGSAGAILLVGVLTAAMVPLRSHMSVATSALLLVVPVVMASAVGGFGAGAVGTVVGFLAYDFVFIPPYYTLSVGAAENWAALGVYGVVMVVVAQVVAQVGRARTEAQRRAAELRRLFDLSELLVREAAPTTLLERIVSSVLHAFHLDGAALLLPAEDRLSLVASAGSPLGADELTHLERSARAPGPLTESGHERGIQTVALSASGQPVGLLALRGGPDDEHDQELLRAFANHLALALERGKLREQALRSQLLEEVDRLRRSLVGAVSHDLRTPLATIKVSTSTLLDPEARVPPEDAEDLLGLIDVQADRLERLVANLLDMTRIQSGSLELRPQSVGVGELVARALAVLGAADAASRVEVDVPSDVPLVSVDEVLVQQVLVNLLDNALRYAPEGTPVAVTAAPRGESRVLVSVTDQGPGLATAGRAGIFDMAERAEAGGRGGLGLAIAKAFVEAHGQRIWLSEQVEGAGARFCFTLPIAVPVPVD